MGWIGSASLRCRTRCVSDKVAVQAVTTASGTHLNEAYMEWEESQNDCWVLILSRELSLCGRLSWLFRRLLAKPRIGLESPRRARLNRSCSAVEMRDSSSRLCSHS